MKKILDLSEATSYLQELEKSEKIVLVGGCFDVLHEGHIRFLNEAERLGTKIILLLESDHAVTKNKGESRPINTQRQRAENLLSKTPVDVVILLPFPFQDHDYDNLVSSIKPAIIATTKGDPFIHHKLRQAEKNGAKVIQVINRLSDYSTTKIVTTNL